MTLYELWLNLVQMLFGTITFFKDHPTVPGVIILILRQDSIRKAINKQLPRKFRDTVDVNILEIKGDLKLIKNHLGVMGEWQSNGQQNGLKRLPLSFNKLFIYLHKVIPLGNQLRRKNMLTSLFKTSVSKKLTALIIGAAVAALNKKFHLDLTPDELLAFLIVIGTYIIGQSHVDGKKALNVKPSATLTIDSDATYTNTFSTIKAVHDGINDLLKLAKENDTVTLSAYGPLLDIIKSVEQTKPLEVVPDVPTEKVAI